MKNSFNVVHQILIFLCFPISIIFQKVGEAGVRLIKGSSLRYW